MPERINSRELAEKVIDAYAHDPEGLTRSECRDLALSDKQAEVLSNALGKGAGGVLTQAEREELASAGFGSGFIEGIGGKDGNRALQERAKWLGDQVVPTFWRKDFEALVIVDFALELRDMGLATPEIISDLYGALRDPFWRIRAAAAEALGRLAPATAVPWLIEALRGKDEGLREHATDTLIRIGHPAVPALIELLKDDDKRMRYVAIWALGQIGPVTNEIVPALIAALKDKDEAVRFAAAQAIGEIGPAAKCAVPALLAALKDKDRDVRYYVILALGSIGPATEEVVPALIVALQDNDANIRFAAAQALGQFGPDAKDAVSVLSEKLWDEYVDVRESAAIALGKIGPEAFNAVNRLIAALQYGYFDVINNNAAIQGLVGIGPGAVRSLTDELKNNNVFVRRCAAIALGKIGPKAKSAVPALIATWRDGYTKLNRASAQALASIGPATIPALKRALKNDYIIVRKYAAVALGEMGPEAKDVIPALTATLHDDYTGVRKEAVQDMIENIKEALKKINGQSRVSEIACTSQSHLSADRRKVESNSLQVTIATPSGTYDIWSGDIQCRSINMKTPT